MTLANIAVFVAEDEALVAMNLEDMLMDLGCHVAGSAMQVEEAERQFAAGLDCDAAILDVNLGGEMIFEFAGQLRARGIPIVFATGYGQEGLPEDWRSHPILQKPYTEEQVAEALVQAVGGTTGRIASS